MTGNIMNFSLFSGSDGDVLSRVLCGQPGMTQAKPDTTQDCDKGNITSETHPQRKNNTLSTSVVPGTGNDDVNKTDPLRGQSVQNSIIANIQEKIRKGTYKIEIAPSDLVDFGGQRSFDMTHQLFMRHKGTFVLMFNGKTDIRGGLGEETTECKLVIDFLNLIGFFCSPD
jgi:anti-sigma28 factor (negative regulator of flagellin synthesis)